MLEFNESTQKAKILAVHYSVLVGDPLLISFMSSETDIESADQAKRIIEGFRQMTDLAVEDHHNNVTIEGISDIEFWMYKLFNKVHGYMVKHGFSDIWDESY
jgi:hypothetical protein